MKTKRLPKLSFLVISTVFYLTLSRIYPLYDASYMSARAAAMGGAYSFASEDAFSMDYNPAVIAFGEDIALSGTFFIPFSQKNIISGYGAIKWPFSFSSFGVLYKNFTVKDLYLEQGASFVHAKRFFDKSFAAGYGINYYALKIDDDQQFTPRLNGSFGIIYNIRNKYFFSISAKNFFYYYKEHQTHTIPPALRTGIMIHKIEPLKIAVEISHIFEDQTSFHIGQEYNYQDFLFLRTGLCSKPAYFSAGVGIKMKNYFQIDYSAAIHFDTGVTHITSINVRVPFLNKKNNKSDDKTTPASDSHRHNLTITDLNKASLKKLIQIFQTEKNARKILTYREKNLFLRKEQIFHIDGFSEKTWLHILPYLEVSSKDTGDLLYRLNHIKAGELLKAGISPESIKNFIFFRDRNGAVTSLENALNQINDKQDRKRFKNLFHDFRDLKEHETDITK